MNLLPIDTVEPDITFLSETTTISGGYAMLWHEFFETYSATSVRDENDKAIIEVEVPGAAREAIKLDYESGRLRISAKYRGKSLNESYVVPEARYDPDHLTASLKDGILTVVVPKRKRELAGRKQILIE
jgi:HSP20 family molecular chaperone IbpA